MTRRFDRLPTIREPRTATLLVTIATMMAATLPIRAETTPPQPAAAQPTLPSAAKASPPKPDSPVVEKMVEDRRPILDVRKRVVHVSRHRVARLHRHRWHRELDRPALAGVQLVEPLPLPGEPPHFTVPVPAFPLDALATAYTTPPPPIVCRPARRDPDAPDPHLYKERPVECMPDNP